MSRRSRSGADRSCQRTPRPPGMILSWSPRLTWHRDRHRRAIGRTAVSVMCRAAGHRAESLAPCPRRADLCYASGDADSGLEGVPLALAQQCRAGSHGTRSGSLRLGPASHVPGGWPNLLLHLQPGRVGLPPNDAPRSALPAPISPAVGYSRPRSGQALRSGALGAWGAHNYVCAAMIPSRNCRLSSGGMRRRQPRNGEPDRYPASPRRKRLSTAVLGGALWCAAVSSRPSARRLRR